MSELNESGKIAVTGATGHLGRLVIESLLDRAVAPSNIVAAVRNPVRASNLAARGVEIREADYTKPDTLSKAFDGVEKLLLVSSSEVGQRAAQQPRQGPRSAVSQLQRRPPWPAQHGAGELRRSRSPATGCHRP